MQFLIGAATRAMSGGTADTSGQQMQEARPEGGTEGFMKYINDFN